MRHRRSPILLCLVLASGLFVDQQVVATAKAPPPPPQWGSAVHDAMRTGTTTAFGPEKGTIRWKRQLEGVVTPGPVVGADGTVYAASNGGVLHAIDIATGKDKWKLDGGGSYGNDLSSSPAILRSGTIVWPGPGGKLNLVSRGGKLLARYQLGSFVLSPAVNAAETLLYAQDMGGTLWAFSIENDRLSKRWSLDVGGGSYSSPALSPDGTIRTSAGNDLVSVKDLGKKGSIQWRYPTEQIIEVSPAVASDGTTVIGSNDAYEYAVNADGSLRWKYQKNAETYGSPAITPTGKVIFGDHRGFIPTLDLISGKEIALAKGETKHSRSRSVGIWTSPAIDGKGNIYVGTRLGHIYGFAAGGARLFDIDTQDTVDSYPAISADGTLLIGSSNAMLYAIRG
jgi:outer membrane protein assembly factor BamB